jgi:hypothetical protein
MTSMYNKLCNKLNGLFFFSKSYLHKVQGSPNECKKTYKPLYLMKSFLFYDKIFICNPILQCNNSYIGFHKL